MSGFLYRLLNRNIFEKLKFKKKRQFKDLNFSELTLNSGDVFGFGM